MTEPPASPDRPVLRIVCGAPSAEELAALVAVVAARAGAADGTEPPARSSWGRPVLRPGLAPVLTPGPGAWRASGLPR